VSLVFVQIPSITSHHNDIKRRIMADKGDPLSWAFWNGRKHPLNSRKDQIKLYAKSPDAQNLFKGVQEALDYLNRLPPGQALRAIRGIIPSQSNGGPSLDPLLYIRTMTPNVHGSAKELQRSHATFEVYGRIVLGQWSLDRESYNQTNLQTRRADSLPLDDSPN
jgi:hypothetical protein